MKTIGLIGGMSWESTTHYYEIINQTIKENLGGLHSAKILMYSVDFAEIEKYQKDGDWDKSGEVLGEIAKKLEEAGADFIVICTNTMHKVAPQIKEKIDIPILHIAEVTADKIKEEGLKKIILLGTKYTMTEDFYKGKLIEAGIEVMIPDSEDVEIVNSIIFNELCLGEIKSESREKYKNIIKKLEDKGAEGVILGCTEIGMLISQNDTSLKVFDTTILHGREAALRAL